MVASETFALAKVKHGNRVILLYLIFQIVSSLIRGSATAQLLAERRDDRIRS